jgi:glutamyl-tRNA synthetase
MNIITRFAPSPTGSLHIGGARTALFNWLYAKKFKGKFLLRIEDTDLERSKEVFNDDICNSLKWLKLNWDENIYFQSKQVNNHLFVAETLLKKNMAYRCYCTKEELEKEKKYALENKLPYKYSGKCRNLKVLYDKPYVIRIKSPDKGSTILNDEIQGSISVSNSNIEDFIIVRSNKTPTYMLSVVVDDMKMGITNVIRGDDHLTNTIKQIIIYNALNWKLPVFAHIPLIYGSDGSKLSKRHGALSVLKYKESGVLSEALINYLLRLGWGYKDKEFFTIEEAKNYFSIKGIGKSPSRFDIVKLKNINNYYFQKKSASEISHIISNKYKKFNQQKVIKIINIFKSRSNTVEEIEIGLNYTLIEELTYYSNEAIEIINKSDSKLLQKIILNLEKVDAWSTLTLEEVIKSFITKQNIKPFNILAPIRVALTGQKYSPSIYNILEILGKKVSLQRLKKVFLNN